jgi:hypothetical protein
VGGCNDCHKATNHGFITIPRSHQCCRFLSSANRVNDRRREGEGGTLPHQGCFAYAWCALNSCVCGKNAIICSSLTRWQSVPRV